MKKEIIQTLKILLTAVVLSLGISYVYAWTAPPQAPPAGNTPAPLDSGGIPQYKTGKLSIGNSSVPTNALEVYGTSLFGAKANFLGDVTAGGTVTADTSKVNKLCLGGICKTSWNISASDAPVVKDFRYNAVWTKPTNLAYVVVRVWGAGGGGGGNHSSGNNYYSGSGGGGGGYSMKIIKASLLSSSYNIIVGTGGTGGASTGNGGNGGNSSFGTIVSAVGGIGGKSLGFGGGTGGGGNYYAGADGGYAGVGADGGDGGAGGAGGAGGNAHGNAYPRGNGNFPGGGGAGGSSLGSTSGYSLFGGNGASGEVTIIEYFK